MLTCYPDTRMSLSPMSRRTYWCALIHSGQVEIVTTWSHLIWRTSLLFVDGSDLNGSVYLWIRFNYLLVSFGQRVVWSLLNKICPVKNAFVNNDFGWTPWKPLTPAEPTILMGIYQWGWVQLCADLTVLQGKLRRISVHRQSIWHWI